MLNQRLNAAQQVNDQLIITERAIDIAIAEAANLAACMPRARVEANLAAEVGHEAIERSAEAVSALIAARRQIVAAHQELYAVQGRIGLATYAIGGLENKAPQSTGLASVKKAA